MKKCYLLLLAILVLPLQLDAQKRVSSTPVSRAAAPDLSPLFKRYSLHRINTTTLAQYVQAGNTEVTLELADYPALPLSLHQRDILSTSYQLIAYDGRQRTTFPRPACMTYEGRLSNDRSSSAYLTITNDLLHGLIRGKDAEYFIEPLRYFDRQAASDLFVVYEPKDVIPYAGMGCGVSEMAQRSAQLLDAAKTTGTATGTCRLVEMAIASDDSMLNKYGTVAAVQEHNIAVMNLMVGIYSNAQFGTQYLEFKIAGQYVAANAAANPLVPLYSGRDASIILNNFADWGFAGNFGFSFDLGQLWTTRDIGSDDGSGNLSYGTIGLAYVGASCSPSKYQLIEDFGSGMSTASLVAHETGHNLDAVHDGSAGFIMAPFLSIPPATTFSTTSLTDITSYITGAGGSCFSACSAITPVAQFLSSVNGACMGNTITFSDYSVGDVTSISWSFPGGTPSSSTDSVQAVTYSTPGLKTVTLSVTNATGSSSLSKDLFISNAPATACRTNIADNSETPILRSFFLSGINHFNSTVFLGGTYDDYSCTDNTALSPGTTYTVTTNLGFKQAPNFDISNKVQLFIDYNNDNDFLDADEAVYSSPTCVQGMYQFSFTTPATVPAINTWLNLRVMALACSLANSNGCMVPSNSQIEDYAVYFTTGTALPVSLLYFDGQHNNGRNELRWQTGGQSDLHYFEVERSLNGRDFDAVGTVYGHPAQLYQFTDAVGGMSSRRFYYRLKVVNKDEGYRYSNVLVLGTGNDDTDPVVIFPNPADKGQVLQISTANNTEPVTVAIYNSLGQLMQTRQYAAGTGLISMDIPTGWAGGTYLVRVSTGKSTLSRPLVIR